ncbi:MAG: hypothetical protein LBU18_04150 [Treponema sp.]|jgi:hypothetical protein|nr:hypothetical protein [Treponema sp.]
MCPDRQILSVYHDRELPSPWKEKMELHLAGCPECRAALARIEALSAAMREDSDYKAGFSPEEAGERVWNALAGLNRQEEMSHRASRRDSPRRRKTWSRSVTISLPAAGAAVFLAVAFTLVLINLSSPSGQVPDTSISTDMELDMPGIVPVSDMNDVLRHLGQDNSGIEFIIIRLPETKSFMSAGEPAIIKAADYFKKTGNR